MAFAESTGRTEVRECVICMRRVPHNEKRYFTAPPKLHWAAEAHSAPCGAHCLGGGVAAGEQDVHIPAFGSCPRCGATDTEVATIVTRPDGAARVVIHRYKAGHHYAFLGFYIELEEFTDGNWVRRSVWKTAHPESLERTLEWAVNYAPWLRDVIH